jgi:hypothetical protein
LIRALQKILGVAVSDADSLSNQSFEQSQALSRDLQAQAEKPKTSSPFQQPIWTGNSETRTLLPEIGSLRIHDAKSIENILRSVAELG